MFYLPKNRRRAAIAAGVVGNILEWYDFALYGFMASVLADLFFPSDDRLVSLIATYGVFATGFAMRPLGSFLFGWMGDVLGRTRTMLVSVALMAIPTMSLGLLPTYQNIGILAPALLVTIRLLQGLSVGGEFSSSVTYLVETAPAGKRGLAGSWANIGSMAGMLMGSGLASLVTTSFSSEAVHDWAWRLPFLFGGVMGVIAIFMRKHLPRSGHFQKHVDNRVDSSPIAEAFSTNRKQMLQATGFASAYGVLFYVILVYLPTWVSEQSLQPLDSAMQLNTVATVLLIPVIPFAGWLSDRYVRRTHLLAATFLIVGLVALPLFKWIASGSYLGLLVGQIALALLIALPCGSAPAFFTEFFPTEDRLSGYSISFNFGLGIVGGTTPMVCTWLIHETHATLSPAYYLLGFALLGAVILLWAHDGSREPLR